MNAKSYYKRNSLIQCIRYSNRIGSHSNCIRVNSSNSYEHEKTKFDICLKLISQGYEIWTEAIFTTGKRADIIAIKAGEGYIIEIETPKPRAVMEEKILSKKAYPPEFELIIIESDKFKIEEFEL